MCQICAVFNPYLLDSAHAPIPTPEEAGVRLPDPALLASKEPSDAASSSATTAQVKADGYFQGTLSSASDSDWIRVNLEGGQTYTVAVVGTGALDTSNDDPYLRIRDASGTLIAQDDDGGPGRSSDRTFTPGVSGTYYIDVQSWANRDAGTYGVSVTQGTRASFDAAMGAGALLRPDVAWTFAAGTGAEVTWSFRASGSDPAGGNALVTLSSAQRDAVVDVVEMLDALSGLSLQQVNASGTSDNATIRIGAYSANDGVGAYAYYPSDPSADSNSGDVWLNNTSVSSNNLAAGTFGYFVLMHEIGHAIGLAHPGDYNAAAGQGITYANSAQFIEDSHQYTVMSYFGETATGASSLGFPDTFMLYDLLAIHQLYGADTEYNGGNTTYGFNATGGGEAYDFSKNRTPLLSIYDGSGQDRVDLSGYSTAQFLNLTPGTFSNVGGYVGNVSIAFGAQIEDAVGGTGSDTLFGNDTSNALWGGAGGDELRGGKSQDTLYGGDGNDTLFGNSWTDVIYGQGGSDQLRGGDGADRVFGGDGGDYLIGHRGNDTLSGEAGNDTLRGSSGADSLLGGAGNDTLHGGTDADTLLGESGADVLYGNQAGDWLDGGTGRDTLYGGPGDDSLFGSNGDDTLYGNHGLDRLDGGAGNDFLRGGASSDAFYYAAGRDIIHDFDPEEDALWLDDGLWTSDLTVVDVVTRFGQGSGDDFVFVFADNDRLTLTSQGSLTDQDLVDLINLF